MINAFTDLRLKNSLVKYPIPDNTMKRIETEYHKCESRSSLVAQQSDEELRHQLEEPLDTGYVVAILREFVQRKFNKYLAPTQLFALLAFILGEKKAIAQIRTGEGKSIIIAMLAAYFALQRDTSVHVVTSSKNLAKRDAKMFSALFEALDLRSNDVCDDLKSEYVFNENVLYGASHDYEFLILEDMFSENARLITRAKKICIIDEVDNLLIDSALNTTRIGIDHPKQRSSLLRIVFMLVKNYETVTPDQLRDSITSFNEKNDQKIDFVSEKEALKLISSAQRALHQFHNNEDYVVNSKKNNFHKQIADDLDEDEDEEEDDEDDFDNNSKEILIVDKDNTGEIMHGCRYFAGVHELIEIKEGVKLRNELLHFSSMSHPIFFNRYDHIYGLTGTVGEAIERLELKKTYGIDCFDIPLNKPSARKTYQPLYTQNSSQHLENILQEITQIASNGRPVLVIFKTIKDTLEFARLCKSKSLKYQLMNERQAQNPEEIIPNIGIPGTVTIVTNNGGRGMDAVLTPQTIKNGGLHVILTYFPHNIRVEEQAIGRSARQGNPGSSRIILSMDDPFIQELVPDEDIRSNPGSDFILLLKQRRDDYTKTLSQHRMTGSEMNIIHHEFLLAFSRLYKEFYKKISNKVFLDNIRIATHVMRTNHNHMDLGEKLDSIAEAYSDDVRVAWAMFIQTIEEDQKEVFEEAGKSTQRYREIQEKKFRTFLTVEMDSYLRDPQATFIERICKAFKFDIEAFKENIHTLNALPAGDKLCGIWSALEVISSVDSRDKAILYSAPMRQKATMLMQQYKCMLISSSVIEQDQLISDFLAFIRKKELLNISGQSPLNDPRHTIESLRIFIAAGLDVNSADSGGNTALHLRAYLGQSDEIELLLHAKANPNLLNKKGYTPIHNLIMGAPMRTAKACLDTLLITKPDLSIQCKSGCTPFLLAVMNDKNHLLPSLMSAGADAITPDNQGNTPLSAALGKRQVDLDLVRYILEQGADPNPSHLFKRSYISKARRDGNTALVNLLIQYNDNKPRTTLRPFCLSYYASNIPNRGVAQVSPLEGAAQSSANTRLSSHHSNL